MSDFFLHFDLPKTDFSINHSHKLTFLGSCFSDEMSKYALDAGFDVLSNPYGTIYHPFAIAKNIIDAIDGNKNIPVLERDDLFYSWDASTKVSAKSNIELEQSILSKNKKLVEHLGKPGILFITFGTAFIYRLKESNSYVANCHKLPGNLFKKEILSVEKIVEIWQEVLTKLRQTNPKLKVVFTVSPVRHIRDGIIENNRSKARLLQVEEELSSLENVEYFPSFEIVIDELRDYRFFKEDRVHPSVEAIKYIWKRFSDLYFDEKTQNVVEEFSKVRKRLAHRSEKYVELNMNTLKSMQHLENEFPWVRWNVEK
jgi:lysophospholipase L1-like esterase